MHAVMDFVEGHERRRHEGLSPLFVFHVWETLSGVDLRVCFRRVEHTRTTFRLHDSDEVDADDFNGQNVIGELRVTDDAGFLPGRPVSVVFTPLFGVVGRLSCRRAERIEAAPCGSEGDDGEFPYAS